MVRPAVVFVEEIEDRRAAILPAASRRGLPRWRVIAEWTEGLSVGEAIAWGVGELVWCWSTSGAGFELWSAGLTPHWSYLRWPPPDLPPLVQRAVPPEDWRCVGGAGSELMWSVTIWLAPRDVAPMTTAGVTARAVVDGSRPAAVLEAAVPYAAGRFTIGQAGRFLSVPWARVPTARALVVPYDDAWPARASALIGRLRSSLGASALRIEHIGSTAISGMAAKDVIDLQVSVVDLDAAVQRFDAPLQAEGFTRLPYERDHVPAGVDDEPARWAKRIWSGAGTQTATSISMSASPARRTSGSRCCSVIGCARILPRCTRTRPSSSRSRRPSPTSTPTPRSRIPSSTSS